MVWRCRNKTTLFSEDGCHLKPFAYAHTEKETNSSGEEGAGSATPGKAALSSPTPEEFTSLQLSGEPQPWPTRGNGSRVKPQDQQQGGRYRGTRSCSPPQHENCPKWKNLGLGSCTLLTLPIPVLLKYSLKSKRQCLEMV